MKNLRTIANYAALGTPAHSCFSLLAICGLILFCICEYYGRGNCPAGIFGRKLRSGKYWGSASGSLSAICSPPEEAQRLAAHWLEVVKPGWALLNTTAGSEDTAAILRRAGVLSTIDFCFCLFEYDGVVLKAKDNFTEHCHIEGLARTMRLRAKLLEGLFRVSIALDPSHFSMPFSFYLDVTDGSRYISQLYNKLGLPVLGFATGKNNRFVLPVPDPHYAAALMYNSSWQFKIPDAFAGFARGMQSHYALDEDPWEEKIEELIYRASCFPTFDPNGRGLVWLRRNLCEAYGGRDGLLNIGISAGTCGPQNCSSNFTQMSVEAMRKYKYQLLVDGFAASYDSSGWKFSSNSIVFFLQDDNHERHLWDLFFYPNLKAYRDYIPTNTQNLEKNVEYCRLHDSICKAISESARKHVQCMFQSDFMVHYVHHVLRGTYDYVQKSRALQAGL